MNKKAVITSGILRNYCLGLLPAVQNLEIDLLADQHPEVYEEIQDIESRILDNSKIPLKPSLKKAVMGALLNLALEETLDLSHPPLVNQHSSHHLWNAGVAAIGPMLDFGSHQMTIVHDGSDRQLILVWLLGEIVEKGHGSTEFEESFLILEGSCECNLGGRVEYLGPGGYLVVPSDTRHSIRCTCPEVGPVKALVQRVKYTG